MDTSKSRSRIEVRSICHQKHRHQSENGLFIPNPDMLRRLIRVISASYKLGTYFDRKKGYGPILATGWLGAVAQGVELSARLPTSNELLMMRILIEMSVPCRAESNTLSANTSKCSRTKREIYRLRRLEAGESLVLLRRLLPARSFCRGRFLLCQNGHVQFIFLAIAS